MSPTVGVAGDPVKTQTVRLFDVFVIGPLMMFGGWKLQRDHALAGQTLFLAGIGTVVYNGRNYLRVREEGFIPGGRAAGRIPSSFNTEKLTQGTRVEMEHTSDPEIAREIAMDHLMEDPRYYEKLLKAGL